MADVIKKATNRFTKGMVLDFSPENTQNEVLTHALNATLLTFNGNEMSLQSDMGNARVESAFLPEGYMPVGTCEYGGIIYIVSYNPLEDKSQIGCFPSPERNISNDELGHNVNPITAEDFQDGVWVNNEFKPNGIIKNNTKCVELKRNNLNPGDKFIITAGENIYGEKLQDLYYTNEGDVVPVSNPILALNIVSIEDSGKITYLNSNVIQYKKILGENSDKPVEAPDNTEVLYHILGNLEQKENGEYSKEVDLDNYRNVLSSGYNVFKSKTSGKLAILAELLTIDSYSVTHELVPKMNEDGDIIDGNFDIIIYPEVSPEISELSPKLQYHYLKNSQGYLQTYPNDVLLFKNGNINQDFYKVSLNDVYVSTVGDAINLNQEIGFSGIFNFPRPETYHGIMSNVEDENATPFTQFRQDKFHRIHKSQIIDSEAYFKNTLEAKFYIYQEGQDDYSEYKESEINNAYTYYIKVTNYEYHDVKRDSENYQNKGITLYKMVSTPQSADKTIVENTSIEKYQYVTVYTYSIASEDDWGNATLYEKDGNTYSEIVGNPVEGNTYYTMSSDRTLVSVGFSPEESEATLWYYPDTKTYDPVPEGDKDLESYWDFESNPYSPNEPYGSPITLYWRESIESYNEVTDDQLLNRDDVILYYKKDYMNITSIQNYLNDQVIFVVVPKDVYVSQEYFIPDESINYIRGFTKPNGNYPKDDALMLYYASSQLPENSENYLQNTPVILANIKIPSTIVENCLDLPFKYDYTLVPCMCYGRLDHLAVSNTVDFSKLHAFNQSDFNTWKYRIDGNQLRLTFGAEIFDTYEENKVDALIIEFYDCWGFAGSLEINNKKSYNGVFTKIISLNSLGSLSKNRVSRDTYTDVYKRNINIQEKQSEGIFTLNNKIIGDWDSTEGWNILETENDCGTLYSNLIYGVKTYIRRTKKDGSYEFIKKRNFFLFTLPLYNDYYYKVQDFTNLTEPQLDLMLTYKLQDESSVSPYTLTSLSIEDGYSANDKALVDEYFSGNTTNTSIDITKYYEYSGTSKLYLEIGLKKDYEQFGITYDPIINKYFSCSLQLVSNKDVTKAYDVTLSSGEKGTEKQILNYDNLLIQNTLKFSIANVTSSNVLNISTNRFVNSNFLTNDNPIPINIEYKFIVGYKAKIDDIRASQIPVTTVCALFHKIGEGEDDYNYEDFNVYKDSEGKYLTTAMYLNTGTSDKEIFGVCKELAYLESSESADARLLLIDSVESDATPNTGKSRLNTGSPLRELSQYIGKLSFFTYHAHTFSDENGVNIDKNYNATKYFVYPELNSSTTSGTNPLNTFYTSPYCNLVLNTKDSINHSSEFISTISGQTLTNVTGTDWNNEPVTFGKAKVFTGDLIGASHLILSNMLNTMKDIYAYNPDYDSITVNIGDVTTQKDNPVFTSNLISYNSKLNIDSLNDYISFGTLQFTKYFNYLNIRSISVDNSVIEVVDSSNVPMSQIKFIPNLKYCGTSEQPCLLTNLTYNTTIPKTFGQDLEFSDINSTIVKKHDGSISRISGTPNKKALYGYNESVKKFIELDVSNYSIGTNGELQLTEYISNSDPTSHNETFEYFSNSIRFTTSVTENNSTKDLSLTFSYTIDSPNKNVAIKNINTSDNYRYVALTPAQGSSLFTIKPILESNELSGNYSYEAKVTKIYLSVSCVALKNFTTDTSCTDPSKFLLYDNTTNLAPLFNRGVNNTVTFTNIQGASVQNQVSYFWADPNESSYVYGNGDIIDSKGCIIENEELYLESGDVNFATGEEAIRLIKFKISKIEFELIQKLKVNSLENTFIPVTKAKNYAKIENGEYIVDSSYTDRCFKGTSFTINDLSYEPNQTGHRLYTGTNLYEYDNTVRARIYYRYRHANTNLGECPEDWKYDKNKNLNALYLFTGPSII